MTPDIGQPTDQENIYRDQIPNGEKKKSSGCGCFAIGCFMLILLCVLPFIGGGIYLASLDDEEWGGFVVDLLKNENFSSTFKVEIQKSTDMSNEQKTMVINLYDGFLKKYDSLPADKQDTIKKNVYVVIKKLFTDPKEFEQKPPAEFLEILTTLGADASITSTITTPPTTKIDEETYDFTPTPIPTPEPTPTPVPTPEPSTQTNESYDF